MSEALQGGQFTFPDTTLKVNRMGYGAMQPTNSPSSRRP